MLVENGQLPVFDRDLINPRVPWFQKLGKKFLVIACDKAIFMVMKQSIYIFRTAIEDIRKRTSSRRIEEKLLIQGIQLKEIINKEN